MAISYGSITIVDITDIGEFSVYPRANGSRTQIYNPDAVTHYVPDWSTSNIVITPVAYYASTDVSTEATYTWQRRDGNGQLTALEANEVVSTVDGNKGVLTISDNKLGTSNTGILSYVVTAHYTVDGTSLEAIGQIDFSLTRQGSTAKTAKINGENIFKYNSAGALVGNSSITLTGTVAGVNITGWQYKNGNSWTTYPNSGSGASLVVNHTDSVFSNDTVTIRLTTSDASTYDQITITKLRDGAKGDSVVSAVLSNEDQMLPANASGQVTSYTGATTQLTIYEGGDDVTSSWTIAKTYENVTDSETDDNIATVNSITADTGAVIFTCTKTGYDTIVKRFSLVKVKTGADGTTPTIYSLEVSTVAVKKDAQNANPNPSTVTFNAYQQTGNTKTPYAGRIQFYIDNSSTISDPITSDVSTRTITMTDATWKDAKKIRGVLYKAGANTDQLDSQTVVIVSDGAKGEDGDPGANGFGAVNVIIDNEADVIPCNSSNHPLSTFHITIGYQAYQGTTVKTTSVNAPKLSATDFGVAITPTVSNNTIDYEIPTTATLAAGGTVSISFTVSAQDYDSNGNVVNVNVPVTKLYSWTRSSAATNGQNAVVLQIVTEDGTIFQNNTGTLTAKGILYDGATEASGMTYAWAQYVSGSGYVTITSTSSSDNVYKNAAGDILTIKAAAVEGYASFRLIASYKSHSYTQYVSFIDKTDPLQVSVHSTVGTQIVNGQGKGAIYARVTRGGVNIDAVPMGIEAGTTLPSNPSTGDFFVQLGNTGASTARTARLVQYNGSAWTEVGASCQYEWTFRDKDNNVITTGVPYQDTTDKTKNQFIYIDSALIANKITMDVKVTAND